MHTLSYLAEEEILFCKGQEYLEAILPDLISQLKKQGYCVIQMGELTEAPLITLRNYLGRGQLHVRADHNGIVTVSPDALPAKALDESHYFGTTSKKHPPHTDGAYLNGFLLHGGTVQRVGPPAIVLMQCVRSAPTGGTSIVIDAQRILQDLLHRTPEVAEVLLRPGCVSFCRDDHMTIGTPVFDKIAANRWRIRFRADEMLYPAEWAYLAVHHLCNHYLANRGYQKHIDLQEGQILVLDNFRVLHGRESFSTTEANNRFIRRAWVHDDSCMQVITNFCNFYKDCRAFERYASYRAIGQPTANSSHLLDLGIRLPRSLQALVNEQGSQASPKAA